MKRFHNVAFSVLVALVCFSVMGYGVANALLPDIFTKSESSGLEKRDYTQLEDVTSASFFEGDAQDEFEQFVADGIPFRDTLILQSARLQRVSIKESAAIFG